MTDIIGRAARVIKHHLSLDTLPAYFPQPLQTTFDDVAARGGATLAQALADAGLLAQPTPTREELTDVIYPETRSSEVRASELGRALNAADAVLGLMARQLTGANTPSAGSVYAREALGVPTRGQVMRAVAPVLFNVSNYPRAGESIGPLAGKIADAVLALLAGDQK